jgi:hypothetical protein
MMIDALRLGGVLTLGATAQLLGRTVRAAVTSVGALTQRTEHDIQIVERETAQAMTRAAVGEATPWVG